MDDWGAVVRASEKRGDWDKAITVVGSVAECSSPDPYLHDAHLWHMDLLAKAGRLDELARWGERDRCARRRLDRLLYEQGRDSELRHRADCGDKTAFYKLVCLLRDRGDQKAARQTVADIDPTDTYATHLALEPHTRVERNGSG
ncbi:hypothetical protein ALI144C_20045 [Actinosynnema sp. ALI-1.44]|uniref:hypothetical protein n=1 Tax=Actinosynnema sp. ALI-1.44 TaxID=1933779 RepID=UPI00097CA78D|nr:hypothetical protein [Actinosynnema sp. ALI-1.44]ONI81595.1 hypothetical protein ALI144C_20045 [Actinosynnema sp. ALI-1.44]